MDAVERELRIRAIYSNLSPIGVERDGRITTVWFVDGRKRRTDVFRKFPVILIKGDVSDLPINNLIHRKDPLLMEAVKLAIFPLESLENRLKKKKRPA